MHACNTLTRMRPIILIAISLLSAVHAAEAPSPDLSTLATADLTNPTYLLDLANVHLKFGSIQRAQPFLRKAMEL